MRWSGVDTHIEVPCLPANPRLDHPESVATRQELGLPIDRPIIMTGHQPVMPHPGLLAKFVMAAMLAKKCDGVLAFLVVDTVTEPLGWIDVPVGSPPLGLQSHPYEFLAQQHGLACRRKPAVVNPLQAPDGLDDQYAMGLDLMHAYYMNAHAETAAEQSAQAMLALLQPWIGQPHMINVSDLLDTPAGQHMISQMQRDPASCASAYQEAIVQWPHAGISSLNQNQLPLWREDGLNRVQTTIQDVRHGNQLLPQALLTTAIARSAICDLFVHGIGGWRYDNVMEHWMECWLGETVAPSACATADLRLPSCEEEHILVALQHARMIHRRVWHDPDCDGKSAISSHKQSLLKAIQAAATNEARHEAFKQLHFWLESHRPGQLSLREAMQGASCARRRDWALPFYPLAQLNQLVNSLSEVEVPPPAIC